MTDAPTKDKKTTVYRVRCHDCPAYLTVTAPFLATDEEHERAIDRALIGAGWRCRPNGGSFVFLCSVCKNGGV